MRGVVLAILVALAASLSGCVPSLHPLVTDKDAVFVPALVGTWAEEGGSDTWKFEKGEGKAYLLTQTSNGVSAHFEARLTKIGGVIFLDTFSKEPPDTEGKPAPADQSDEGNLFLYLHYVPAHLISRVGMSGDALRISMMNPAGTYALLVMIDRDTDSQPDPYIDLDQRLTDADLDARGATERIAIFVPKRSVETWVYHLLYPRRKVEESSDNSKPKHGVSGGGCRRAGSEFSSYDPPSTCPLPSLVRGCQERSRIP